MIRKNLTKIITMCFMAAFILGMANITAHAETVRETEPNDTMETAELILANYETPAQAVTGNRPGQYVVKGDTSQTDEDWFKVQLSAGTQYITCNGADFNFEIYDPNKTLLVYGSFIKGSGVSASPFNAPMAGTYYLKITGNRITSTEYIISIGGPTYYYAGCEVRLNTVTMANSRDGSSAFDLRAEDVLPDGAVVDSIVVDIGGSRNAKSVTARNLTSNNTISLMNYTWSKTGLVNLNMPLKGNWTVTYGYNKNVSFNPSITFQYVYPLTSTTVPNKIVISQ